MVSIKGAISKAASGKSPFESSLEKLTIMAYDDAACTKEKSGRNKFKVQFNPTKIDETVSIDFVEEKPPGAKDAVNKFKHINGKEFKLSITIDGTGVSGQSGTTGKSGMMGLTADKLDVLEEIKAFKEVTCEYDGKTHDIPFVKITWGPNTFTGRLISLNISHVMFKASGEPLRSVLDATFTSATDLKKQALEANKSSPDLTHIKTVQIGDTLPLMCQEIYNDSSYYLKVAKFNNIIDFRNLEPGTEIIFPPIV